MSKSFDVRSYPIVFQTPRLLTGAESWQAHIPVAFLLVELLRPNIYVELGTFRGDSYCAICQAVDLLGLATRCYAIDTWAGDEHTGPYGRTVLDELKAHHDPLYSRFSRLIRSTFDEALQHFADGTVDLLHIDGYHTYDAVRHDFETWQPKLDTAGVVMFNEINVRERDFGVWRFWEEISAKYPHASIAHGNGLGILAIGSSVSADFLSLLACLDDAKDPTVELLSALGERVVLQGRVARLRTEVDIYRRDVPVARERILAQDTELVRLRAQVSQQHLDHERRLAASERQASEMKAAFERNRESLEYRAMVSETHVRRLNETVARFIQSTSWRITAPLRLLSILARRIRAPVETPRGPRTDRAVVPARRPRRILRALLGLSRMLGDTLRSPPETGRKLRKLVRTFTQGGLHAVLSELRNAVVYRTAPHVTAHPSGPHQTALPEQIALSEVPVNSIDSDPPVPGTSIDALRAGPTISIVMPVYEIDPALFEKAVRSVLRQSYPNWELCIVDDASKRSDLKDRLTDIVALDDRIRLVHRPENGGISIASNDALALAAGDFVAFLDNDDELALHALLHVAAVLDRDPSIDVVYSDEDKLDEHGMHCEPFRKPDWSPEYLRGVMYVGHLLVIRRAILEEIGGFDARYDGAQDFELMLRVSERTDRIAHLPVILYHWRKNPGSVAATSDAKPYIQDKQVAAVNAHLDRLAIKRQAAAHPTLPHRVVVTAQSRDEWPSVSIIVPTKDQSRLIGRCLETIFATTTYQNFQVVVVDNGTSDPSALTILEDFEARHPKRFIRVQFDRTFNFSTANNLGATYATGKYLLLLNNDTEIVQSDWLQELVALAEEPGVGAVGALLVYPNGTIQHAGVALGLRGTADHICRGFRPETDGYAGSIVCSREVSAVTAACLLLSSDLYREIGGLREGYRTHYQDVDLCLRIRARNLRILYTPRARVVHHESASRAAYYDLVDRALLIDTWRHALTIADPYCSPLVKAFRYAPPPPTA